MVKELMFNRTNVAIKGQKILIIYIVHSLIMKYIKILSYLVVVIVVGSIVGKLRHWSQPLRTISW